MPTPSSIISASAVLMNDASKTRYNNVSLLPLLNIALDILQEIYELNGLPISNGTSAIITIPSRTSINTYLGYDTNPSIPGNVIEIQQLWESPKGLNQWTPMVKKEFIPHYLEDGTQISQFLIWAWEQGKIVLISANAPNDIKMDYISSVFNTPIDISLVNINLPFTNIKTYLEFETAALAAMFIAENESRYMALSGLAGDALSRAIGIPVKGMQSIVTRRRPFRASFKRRGISY